MTKVTTQILKHGKEWAEKNVGKESCPECGNGASWLTSYEKATLDGIFSASTFKCETCDCVFEKSVKR